MRTLQGGSDRWSKPAYRPSIANDCPVTCVLNDTILLLYERQHIAEQVVFHETCPTDAAAGGLRRGLNAQRSLERTDLGQFAGRATDWMPEWHDDQRRLGLTARQ